MDYLSEEELLNSIEQLHTKQDVRNLSGEQLLQLRWMEFEEQEKEREAYWQLKELELKGKELAMLLKIKELEVKASSPTASIDSTPKKIMR